LVGLGTTNILYRNLVRDPENKNLYLGTTLRINIISAFFAQAIMILVAFLFSEKDVSFWVIAIISFNLLFGIFNIFFTEFSAYVNYKLASIVIIVGHLIPAILKIIFVLNGYGILYISLIMVLEGFLIAFGIYYVRTKKYGSISDWKYDSKIAKSMLQDSWPLIIVSAFTVIYSKIDQVMIKYFIDAKAVGLYDASVKLSEIWYFIPTTIVNSIFPAFINAEKESDLKLENRIKKVSVLLLIISIGIATIVTIMSDHIINLIYGKEYAESSLVLKIYVWSLISTSFNLILNQYLIIKNKRKTIIAVSFSSVLTNIILNVVMIPRFGIIGAAWATFISYLVPLFYFLIIKMKK
jgi:O-antigen/teichoic acid export membrane protein